MNVNSTKCFHCTKSVFAAEEIRVAGNPWHKTCFKCKECNKLLELGKEATQETNVFCQPCYSKRYGPKGVGFGNTLSTESPKTAK